MRLSNRFSHHASLCMSVVLSCLATQTFAYFVITEPTSSTQWKNGEAHVVTWSKGGDDITGFDVELARLGDDGLIYVARDVPCIKGSTPAINIALVDIPPADDYFVLFLNSTIGTIFSTSDRFSILSSSSSADSSSSSSSPTPNSAAATVTISGTPNPTKAFVTTFPASNGALRPLVELSGSLVGLGTVLASTMVAAVWTLW
ncbi:hypothetical protein VKT23_017450 [Stygiomarasmius scandens]|uniref:Uncharacterized protein n=1 Tax=Marasmiellus scandens TaxID=2682957 RepID=A0ABR1IRZ6_9AGAR